MVDVLAGAGDALTPINILFVIAGVCVGIAVGAIPGLNGPMAIAIAIPATFWLSPLPAIGFLIGIMKGSSVGGAIPAILMNTPGTPDAALTALDGYPLAQRGQSGKALKMGLYASVTGDTLSDIVLFTVAVPLSLIALRLGPVEQAALIFFSICVIAGLIGGNPFRGLIAAAMGFVLASVGQAPEEATPRLTFGFPEIEDGLPLVSVGMGVLVLGEIVHALAHRRGVGAVPVAAPADEEGRRLRFAEYRAHGRTMLRSAAIGTSIGAIPGVGSTVAATLGYSAARRASPTPEAFGKGTLDGVAATEAANSAVAGANLIPLLSIGIPGNLVAAFLLGALIVHGVVPGPTLIRDEGRLVYAIFTAMAVANLSNLAIGRLGLGLFALAARVRAGIVYPCVVLLCMTGAYVGGGGAPGLVLLAAFGVFGYALRVLNLPIVTFLIAFVLGRLWELPLTQAVILTKQDPLQLVDFPIALAILALGVALVLYRLLRRGDKDGCADYGRGERGGDGMERE